MKKSSKTIHSPRPRPGVLTEQRLVTVVGGHNGTIVVENVTGISGGDYTGPVVPFVIS